MRIGTIGNAEIAKLQSSRASGGGDGDFAQQLMDVMKEVNESQLESRNQQEAFLTNQPGADYHDLMIAMERASTAMQLTMQVRNKVLEAYQEISRMQV